ncbi:hypothetical protein GTW93_41860 [Streptomyces sp. SID5789]|nr:hypothetical protein [Streptomyces sp. SID5789]
MRGQGHAPRPSPFDLPVGSILVMADTQQVDTQQGDPKADRRAERRVARLARSIDSFSKAHGGAEAQVAYLGERGARIVLVGEDGAWGDLVARSHETARQAVEKSGLTVHEDFDGEFAAKVTTGRYEWSRMAGIQVGGPSNT